MFDFLKGKNKGSDKNQPNSEPNQSETNTDPSATPEKKGFFARLKQGLKKTRSQLSNGIATIVLGKKTIDAELLQELEEQLLLADIGVAATQKVVDEITARIKRKQVNDPEALMLALKEVLLDIIKPVSKPLQIANQHQPFVILVVGVNGVGKTTTIGKLAKLFQNQGKKVMLAAGDTFRAAAIEQLQVWGDRNEIPVIAQQHGADSASVIFDAMQAAKARQIDVLIADTAGRLHTKSNLMEELKKVKRVLTKLDADAPHEVMLVLDAGTGQNALSQAQLFHQAIVLTGITLTKLDGTAKGGIIFAIADALKIPIRFIGVGEQLDDLRTFEAQEFVDALFADDKG